MPVLAPDRVLARVPEQVLVLVLAQEPEREPELAPEQVLCWSW